LAEEEGVAKKLGWYGNNQSKGLAEMNRLCVKPGWCRNSQRKG
jgi:hypothetical protein